MSDGPACTLGIDPGTAIMGYGVVAQHGNALRAIDFGVLTTSSTEPMPQRLLSLHTRLGTLIATHRPVAVAVESLFFNRNVRTAIPVGQARGIVLLAAAQAGVPVAEYTPLQVKDAVVGYGRATKDQVQQMIRMLLDLDAIPRPDDAADALAIAICHLHSARIGALAGG
jgi:crossover junction endodeoxyribonuclease RuvC